MSDAAHEEMAGLIERLVGEYTAGDFVEDWDVAGLLRRIEEMLGPTAELAELDPNRIDREELIAQLQEEALARYGRREEELGPELMRALERFLLLQIIDQRWLEHLNDMDYLRQGIGLRGAAQLDPLVAYKNEAFELFRDLMNTVWDDFARMIFHVEVMVEGQAPAAPPVPRRAAPGSSSPTGGGRVSYSGGAAPQGALAIAAAAGAAADGYESNGEFEPPPPVEQRRVDPAQAVGRNDPCPCGSGKKYKKCHGA